MDKWREVRLGDIADIGTGKTNRQDETENGVYPLFDRSSVVKRSDKYLFDCKAVIIPGEGKEFLPRYFSGKFDLHQRAYRITSKSEDSVKTKFLYYYLNKHRYYWERVAVGTTVKSLRLHSFKDFPVQLPSIEEQKAIVYVLGTLDDKIELNQQMNETLESMAQAIFKDWFVDFGPTRRKMEGATDPDVIIGGLINSRKSNYSFELPISSEKNANIAGLFPATLSNLNLPEGWRECKVSAFGKIRGGQQLTKSEFFSDGLIPVFGGAGHMGQTNKSNVEGFIISVGRVGAYCGNFVAHRGYAWINNNASFFDLFKTTEPEWFFYALRNLKINQIRKGAAQPFVSNRDIANLTIVYPDEKILSEFQFFVVPLIKLIEENNSEKQVLIEIRDFLLQKLISGEIFIHNDETCT